MERGLEARPQRGPIAAIDLVPQDANRPMSHCFLLSDGKRRVAAAVIDDNDFMSRGDPRQGLRRLADGVAYDGFLIISGQDERYAAQNRASGAVQVGRGSPTYESGILNELVRALGERRFGSHRRSLH